MDGGGEDVLIGGLAVSQSRRQLVALRQQLVHLGDNARLIGKHAIRNFRTTQLQHVLAHQSHSR